MERKYEMRVRSLLMATFLSALVLFGFQLLSQSSKALMLAATVDIKPDTLNLNMKGKWITAYVTLPEGYNVTDIDKSTIVLEGLFGPEWSNIEDGRLMIKFDASSVIGCFYHMDGKRESVELTVPGQLLDGTQFSGTDRITIMKPAGN